MDRIRAMQVFVQVAELGSFSKAAERLGLPPPTASNAIRALERQLGVRLLQRTTRKVSLTEEGMLYLERCTRLLADIEDTDVMFAGPHGNPRGVVRVDLPERLARLSIIPALPDFFAAYPNIQIKLATNDRFANIVGEGIDCAVRVGSLADSSLIARRIGEMEQVNCAAPAYIARYGVPRKPRDLEKHMTINYFSSRTGRDIPWEYMERGQLHMVKMRGTVSVSSSEAYLACCLAGLGLVQVPRNGVEPYFASGTLIEVMPKFRAPPLPVSIVYSHSRQMSPRVRVFVDWVAELLGDSAKSV